MATLQDLNVTEVEDDLAHFLGIVEFNDRSSYFEDSNPRWGMHQQPAVTADNRLRVLNKIIKELERVDKIRSMIAKEPSEKHLVICLKKSCQAWKESGDYQLGIGESHREGGLVNNWSKRPKFDTSPSLDSLKKIRSDLERISQSQSTAALGLTHSPRLRSRELPRRPSATRILGSRKSPTRLPPTNEMNGKAKTPESNEIAYDADEDFNAYLIQYEKSGDNFFKPSQVKLSKPDTKIAGSFPDQRIPIRHLLGEITIQEPSGTLQRATVDHQNKPSLPAGNILKDFDLVANKIRYFHFPANNMAWAERAIALYYEDDEVSTSPGNKANSTAAQQSKIHTLLRPEYWRGQQQGDRGAPVHARHMRPLCETISLTTDDEATSHPKDVVIFMPFLHWETDRKRHTFANFIDTVTAAHKADNNKLKAEMRSRDITAREGLVKPTRFNKKESDQKAPSPGTCMEILSFLKQKISQEQQIETMGHQGDARPPVTRLESLVDAMNLKKLRLEIDEHRRVKSREPKDKNNQNRLGQYLLDAARLYEGITNYRDKKLLHKYLHVDPPIHPRRTLDQAYYWSLNTTQGRDRDQVVYRGTRAAVEHLHQFDIDAQVWPKHEEQKDAWTLPASHDDDGPCQACQTNIRKISRLVMVDQLWLWVLDEHTIMTFFPRRYGTNKNDVTGVHKSIRMRLERISKSRHPEQQMGSVWDLALIIFDECTNTFFDRTKTPDRQPQIIDDFSEAIGNVTIAFDRLWAWTEQWKANNSRKTKSRTIELHVSLLDINPEGKLQREIKDIIEELEIMIHINRTHKTILKSFIHQVIHIMDPNGRLKNRFSMLKLDEEHTEGTGPDPKRNNGSRKASGMVNETDYNRFESKAEELLSKVTSRIEELEELRRSAQSTSDSIKDLLALKQQQASVVQAWQAAQQTDETVAQGRSIMMFTVVTIVFAPLSFMTSVFGMNAWEFSPEQNTWKILDELKYILPVSVAVILLVLFLAFNPYVRAIVKAWYYRISAKLLTKKTLGGYSLYKVWYAKKSWRGEVLIDKAHTYARGKKEAAREEVLKKRREKSLQTNLAQSEQNNGSTDQFDDDQGITATTPQGNNNQQDDTTSNGGADPRANGTQHDDDGKGAQVTGSQANTQRPTWWRRMRGLKGEEAAV